MNTKQLTATFAIFASCLNAQGAIIAGSGITATATSYWAAEQNPVNLTNRSGLTPAADNPAALHAENGSSADQWHAASGQGTQGAAPVVDDQVVTFDLGQLYNLSAVYIWQHNQPGSFGRGVNQFDLLYSADNVTYTPFANDLNLAISTGGPNSSQMFAFSQTNVRYVQIAIDSAHSGATNDYVGLAEVMFDGVAVPEPGSAALLFFAGAGLVLRRRR